MGLDTPPSPTIHLIVGAHGLDVAGQCEVHDRVLVVGVQHLQHNTIAAPRGADHCRQGGARGYATLL